MKKAIYIVMFVLFLSYSYALELQINEDSWAGGGSMDDRYGVLCVANQDITVINVTVAPDVTVPLCAISIGESVNNITPYDHGTLDTGTDLCPFTNQTDIDEGVYFRVFVEPEGSNYQGSYNDDVTFPKGNSLINCTSGTYDTGPNYDAWNNNAAYTWDIAKVGVIAREAGGGSQGSLSIIHDMSNTSNIDATEMPYVISYNGTISDSGDEIFNCSLRNETVILDTNEVNLSTTNGFSFDFEEVEHDYIFDIYCENENGINDTTTNHLYRVDSITPELTLTSTFTNNSDLIKDTTLSIDYQANDTNIFSVNVTWFDSVGESQQSFFIDQLIGSGYGNTTSKLLGDTCTNCTIRFELTDSHTGKKAKPIQWTYAQDTILVDNFVMEGDIKENLTAFWLSEDETKYKFKITWEQDSLIHYLNLSSNKYLQFVESNYKGHFILREQLKGIDFEGENIKQVNIQKLDEKYVLEIELYESSDEVEFDSIFDLNTAVYVYYYDVVSQDTQYLSEISTTLTNIYGVINVLPVIMIWITLLISSLWLLLKGEIIIGMMMYFTNFLFDFFIVGWLYNTYATVYYTGTLYTTFMGIFIVGIFIYLLVKLALLGGLVSARRRSNKY